MTPWENHIDLEDVLNHIAVIGREKMAGREPGMLPSLQPRGNTVEEIDEHAKRIGRPIPEEIRQLYSVVDGIIPSPDPVQTDTFLLALEESQWVDPDKNFEFEQIEACDPEWADVDFYGFAATRAGDWIVWCDEGATDQPGTVVLLDHECANDIPSPVDPREPTPIVILGNTLSQWLRRWCDCGFEEHSIYWARYWEGSKELLRNYLEDHIRLNPGVKWAKEHLARLNA